MHIRRPAAFGLLCGLSLLAASAAAQTKSATPASAASPPPQHVESINFDHWVVTCREISGGSQKACVANLRLLGSDGKQLIASWQIGADKDNHLVSVFQIPTSLAIKGKDDKVSSGISIKNGVDIKFGPSGPRHLTYVACTPQLCEAVTPVDEAFVKDAAAGGQALVTSYTANGVAVPLSFDIKGLDKVLAAVASKHI